MGLSLTSNLLETISIIINLSYNYRLGNPFSTYGEGSFITIQNLLIMSLILSYRKNTMGAIALVTGILASLYILQDQSITSMAYLNSLQLSTIAISVLSKLPQVSPFYHY